jgi:hypothetical protein
VDYAAEKQASGAAVLSLAAYFDAIEIPEELYQQAAELYSPAPPKWEVWKNQFPA